MAEPLYGKFGGVVRGVDFKSRETKEGGFQRYAVVKIDCPAVEDLRELAELTGSLVAFDFAAVQSQFE